MFGKLFGGSKEPKAKKILAWKNLTEVAQLDEIEKLSKGKRTYQLKEIKRKIIKE